MMNSFVSGEKVKVWERPRQNLAFHLLLDFFFL